MNDSRIRRSFRPSDDRSGRGRPRRNDCGRAAFGGDKSWLAVDRTNGPGRGFIYNMWHPQESCCGQNVLTRSTNGGEDFDYPVPVLGWPTFGTLAVGPTGAVFAAGIDGTPSVRPDWGRVRRRAFMLAEPDEARWVLSLPDGRDGLRLS